MTQNWVGCRAIIGKLNKYFTAEPTATTRQGGIMKFLQNLLSEETIKELNEKLGEDLVKQVDEKIGDYKINPGKEKLIPKTVYDTDKAELKKLLDDRDSQLKDLSNKAKDNEGLVAQIKTLQDANKQSIADYEAKLTAQSQKYAYEKALAGFKPRNINALDGVIDKSKLSYKENNGEFSVEGLNEQIEALKKSDAYLFEGSMPTTPNPQNHNNLDKPTDADNALREAFGLAPVENN